MTLTAPVQGVTLQVGPVLNLQPGKGSAGNLLALSNKFGWAIIASNNTINLFKLDLIRSTYKNAESRSTPELKPQLSVMTNDVVEFVRFGMSDKVALAGMRGGSVGVWRLKSLVEGNVS